VGKAVFPIVESSAQHIFGWFEIATVALRSDHESLDWADVYVEASTELKRCVLDRVGPPNRGSPGIDVVMVRTGFGV
jgi:CO dehydrogenase/acetyl-CoA synthase delta subunit